MPQANAELGLIPTQKNLELLRAKFSNLSKYLQFRQQHSDRLNACELAFFVYNASLSDGPKERDALHPSSIEFKRATQNTRERCLIELKIRRAIFDHVRVKHVYASITLLTISMQAALLDQLTGSTTLVVSMPGAAEPGTPASEEFVKVFTYFPGSIRREVEASGHADTIPDLIQVIIRELGVPTLRSFERAVKRLWKRPRRTITSTCRPLPEVRGIPAPIPLDSSRYIFYGRKLDGGADDAPRPRLSAETLSTLDSVQEQVYWPSQATLRSSFLEGQARDGIAGGGRF